MPPLELRDKIRIYIRRMVNVLPYYDAIEIENDEKGIKIYKADYALGDGELNITINWLDNDFDEIPISAKIYTSKPYSYKEGKNIHDRTIEIDKKKLDEVVDTVLYEIRLLYNHIW
jgi:hypothetical protein